MTAKKSFPLLQLSLFVMLAALVGLLAWRVMSGAEKIPKLEYMLVDGTSLNSKALSGNVVVVNFWATTCSTCVADMPNLIQTYEHHKANGLKMIAVATDQDKLEDVVRFYHEKKLPFDVTFDSTGKIAYSWGGIEYTPTTFVVDRKGMVVEKLVGEEVSKLNQVLEQLM